MKPRPRLWLGFTLLEGLFSMLLVLLILGALARTLSNSAKVRANRQNMDQAIEQLHIMNTIRADVMASLVVLEPSSGAEVSSLRLRMVDPKLPFLERIDTVNGSESPYDSSEQVEVRYVVRESSLIREVASANSEGERIALSRISDLRVSHQGQLLSLSLTFPYSRVEKTRTMKVEIR